MNVLCSGHGDRFKHVQSSVVIDHESCPHHDAVSTISIPFLDNFRMINTANFTPYQYPSTIGRKAKLSLISEEGIDLVVLGADSADADRTIVNVCYGKFSQYGSHTTSL